jgi:hypothetical protein
MGAVTVGAPGPTAAVAACRGRRRRNRDAYLVGFMSAAAS